MGNAVGHPLEEIGGYGFTLPIADANDAAHGSFLAWASGGFLREQGVHFGKICNANGNLGSAIHADTWRRQ
jgi:hypothetical protein